MRDDFSNQVKELLAKRVAFRCSNPGCRQTTSGPQDKPDRVVNIGVAAHITAASEGGPRYDRSLTPEQRRSADNGIWLCQNCGKMVDNDPLFYDVDILRQWKSLAETMTAKELRSRRFVDPDQEQVFIEIERLMPELLVEMRTDLTENPTSREFVVLKRSWSYWARGHELFYYYDDHPQLTNQLRILENHGLIQNITYNNAERYVITERLARYLTTG